MAFFSVFGTVIVICVATPIFILVIVPLGILYFVIQVWSIHICTIHYSKKKIVLSSVSTWPHLVS